MIVLRWFFLCLLCATVFFVPKILITESGIIAWCVNHLFQFAGHPELSQTAIESAWFLDQMLWSFFAICVAYEIGHRPLSMIIAFVEGIAMIISTIAMIQYLNWGGLFYRWDVQFMHGLAALEAAILVIGAPWHGLHSVFVDSYRAIAARLGRVAYKVRH